MNQQVQVVEDMQGNVFAIYLRVTCPHCRELQLVDSAGEEKPGECVCVHCKKVFEPV